MAGLAGNRTVDKGPTVTFSVAVRSATPIQVEAGRRLFGRLIARAQAEIAASGRESTKKSEKKKANGRQGAKGRGGTAGL